MTPFAKRLSPDQLRFARAVEAVGLASYSPVVKAFERREFSRINAWQAQLAAKREG